MSIIEKIRYQRVRQEMNVIDWVKTKSQIKRNEIAEEAVQREKIIKKLTNEIEIK